ncbi:MAG: recombinase RecA, partial [Acidiferrobacterales bacterium]
DQNIGNRTKAKVVKNKMAPPFREAHFDINFGQGISREGELLDLGVEHKIIEKSGSWFSYGQEQLGQGREHSKVFLRENPEISGAIEHKLKVAMGSAKPLQKVEAAEAS